MKPYIKVFSIGTCKDCATYHQIIHDFATEYDIDYAIIDVDREENLHEILQRKLQYIPSTLVFKDGICLRQAGEILTKEALTQLVYGL
jgi:thioredoxin-like negative regulator of GroEL